MKRYTVIVLGARGAGKTVFLASLFRKLGVAGDYGFFLGADMHQKLQLNAVYNLIVTNEGWPDATQFKEISEWEFTCKVVSRSGKIYDAFEIVYLDYSGGRLTDITSKEESGEFQSLLNNADCLLGLLDGQKVYDYMEGIDKGGRFQNIEMAAVLQMLNESSNPVHVVISKWDLLEGRFNLEQIRDKLLQDPLFENLVKTKSRLGAPIRLIPVSSVGSGFAVREADGIMRKLPGAVPNPFQVEMPFALVLPDKIKSELERIAREEAKISSTQITVRTNLSLWDKLGRVLAGAVRTVKEYLPDKLQYTEKILRKIADRAERGATAKLLQAKKTEEQYRLEIQSSLAAVKDQESALEHTINSFLELERKLNFKFPASRLDMPS
ncbi:MAG TPA: hypothetical protein VD861_21100 [Pyrinomonadaceae bacterium]|nr:hypothetical protein [Pyrinomonadaceae bacterium]